MDPETLARLGRPHLHCSRCNAPLAQRAGKHQTAIVQGPLPVMPNSSAEATAATSPSPDDLHRLDICPACWPAERERLEPLRNPSPDPDSPRVLGIWMTKRVPPKPKPARTRPSRAALLAWWDDKWAAVAKAALTAPTDSDRRVDFVRAHLAALILMRHGALRWLSTQRPEEDLTAPEILSFRRTATQNPVRVAAYVPASETELDELAESVDADMQAFLEALESNDTHGQGISAHNPMPEEPAQQATVA